MTLDTIKGQVTGEPLVSVWRHFPEVDHDPHLLAQATIREQQRYPSDIIKLSPQGRFPVVDFGCKIQRGTTEHGSSGSSSCVECRIKAPEDWASLDYVDPLEGELGKQLDFIREVAEKFPDVPKMMTIFSPTMVARKLSANKFAEHFFDSEYQASLREAISVISGVMTEFGRACVDAGAEGLFIAVQEADTSVRERKEELVKLIRLNRPLVEELHRKAEFTVLHVHGHEVLFKEAVEELRTTAVNWHDIHGKPSLEGAPEFFKGGLFGGLDPDLMLRGEIGKELESAVKLRDEIPLILAPGCVLWQGTDERTIEQVFREYKNA